MRQASFPKLDRRGMTAVELILAILIFGIIGSVLVTIFVSAVSYYSNEKSQLINQQNISAISSALESDTRKSTTATTSGSCLVLTQSGGSTSTYCLNTTTHVYTRNNVHLADNISTVSVTISLNKLVLTVTTDADHRGVSNTIHLTYYLREGNY